jgi:hypothetical protein
MFLLLINIPLLSSSVYDPKPQFVYMEIRCSSRTVLIEKLIILGFRQDSGVKVLIMIFDPSLLE